MSSVAFDIEPVRPVPLLARMRSLSASLGFVLPLLLLMVLAFNLPMLAMLGRSVGFPDVTAEHYQELFSGDLYVKVILNTFQIAAVATLACVLLGYPLAYWMRGLSPTAQLVCLAMVVVPFWVSVLIRTYAWIIILGNAGIVNTALRSWGLVDGPISFLYNRLGVTIGIVNVLLPFLVLPLFAAMSKIDERLLHAARSLGASNTATFWRVVFPLTLPALSAGALLVFIMAIGFYVTPMILGGGRVPMLVNMLDLLVNGMPNWNLAAAISALMLVVTLALYALSRRVGAEAPR
jgi:putative spermidine/putrescine transport system permease protein